MKTKYASSDMKNPPLKSKEVSYVKPIISNFLSKGKEPNSTLIDSSNISTNEKNIEYEYFMLNNLLVVPHVNNTEMQNLKNH